MQLRLTTKEGEQRLLVGNGPQLLDESAVAGSPPGIAQAGGNSKQLECLHQASPRLTDFKATPAECAKPMRSNSPPPFPENQDKNSNALAQKAAPFSLAGNPAEGRSSRAGSSFRSLS